ncbi:hypothetical protein HOP50_04g35330 [Chloropicon primus]|uniref:Prokaryotic-type class I peptide chain release factors domain-containing protein n=1 Tax=Chloropicon primus TaxID=1764295 RepID=A0A5B8MK52_9CHLO|nr:hypothetical protein A3770_04p35260 [Chloropicon primus]UPR00219.1 hypothetical protein HOP50_04g35330 [Chloropicon primus]|eukprot:QDZ21008.1 hypothetical protein A3770_04p35260 [Chloropicon primus]
MRGSGARRVGRVAMGSLQYWRNKYTQALGGGREGARTRTTRGTGRGEPATGTGTREGGLGLGLGLGLRQCSWGRLMASSARTAGPTPLRANLSTGVASTEGPEEREGEEEEEEIERGVYNVRPVTREDVEVKFIRSGGAGGQNVNKVNTKADVRLDLDRQDWIPPQVKRQVMRKEKNRINKEGELVVSSTKHRTQKKNLEDAMAKMQRFLDDAVTSLLPIESNPVKEKKMKKKLRQANEKRLDKKKKHSMKKKERRRKDW